MGVSERRAREKEQRRKMLIDTAERIFFDQGFEITTMAHIAHEAEFSKRTLYLYFRDKEELIFAVAARGFHLVGQTLGKVKRSKNGRTYLFDLLQAYFRFAMDQSDYYRATMFFETQNFYYGDPPEHLGEYGRLCWQRNKENSEIAHRAVTDGVADGSIVTDLSPSQFILLIWSQTIGLIQLIQARLDLLEPAYAISAQKLFTQFMEQLDRGIESS